MVIGGIYLVKRNNKRIVPAIIVDINKNGRLLASQLKPFTDKKEKNVVYIGKPDGLRNESVAIAYFMIEIKEKDILSYISKIEEYQVKEIIKKYEKFLKMQNLHKELNDIKKKIALAQFNNQDYKNLEERKSKVLEELGYKEVFKSSPYRQFNGFREAPSTGYIKVYKGGR